MYKFIATLLTMGLFFGTNTYAQNKPLACQEDAAGGLDWEKGRWMPVKLTTSKYILVLRGNTLTENSASKVLGEELSVNPKTTCLVVFGERTSCFDELGGYLIFDPKTMKGAVAQILGGTSLGSTRDTLSVKAFTCQPF